MSNSRHYYNSVLSFIIKKSIFYGVKSMGVPLPILMVIAIIVIIFITVATILAVNKGYSFKHEIDPKPEKSYKAGERK